MRSDWIRLHHSGVFESGRTSDWISINTILHSNGLEGEGNRDRSHITSQIRYRY